MTIGRTVLALGAVAAAQGVSYNFDQRFKTYKWIVIPGGAALRRSDGQAISRRGGSRAGHEGAA